MEMPIKLLDPRAKVPTYGSPDAAGADLYALTDGAVTVQPGETVLIHTGIALELPAGYAGLIYPRSGLATKRGLAPANKVGVVDPDYRGEVMVALHNHSAVPQTVADGERIAQLVVTPFLRVDFTPTDTLSDTVRGAGGFGSTGTGASPAPDARTSAADTPHAAYAAPRTAYAETPRAQSASRTSEQPAQAAKEAPPAPDRTAEPAITPNALTEEALRYYHGLGAPYDRRQAVKLLRAAAESGDTLATAQLAYLSCIGDEVAGIEPDPEHGKQTLAQLLPQLKTRAELGSPDAVLLLGNMLVGGFGIPMGPRRAVELYYRASEADFAPATNAMGQCYASATGVRADDLRAIACFRRAAEAGYAPAQYNLGVCLFNGKGVRQDKKEAVRWYAAAAEQGYAPAQYLLGKHYFQVMSGVENNPAKGIEWLTRAAEQGNIRAMDYLADVYHHAGNREADTRAAHWYAVAAGLGDPHALYQLACYTATGRGGVIRDPERARDLLARSASAGNRDAQRLWLELYGVPFSGGSV